MTAVNKAFLLFAIAIGLCGMVGAQTNGAEPPKLDEAYLARDDGKGKAGEQMTEFLTTDIPIYCVVLLDAEPGVIVKMVFVAVNVRGVKPETKVVTASYKTQEGQNRVNFTGRPEGRWAAGEYRVDLFLDGEPATNLKFEIKQSGPTTVPANNLQRSTKNVKTPARKPGQ